MKLVEGTSYFSCGDGDTVIFIHGVGLDKSMWGGQVAGLSPHYQVISYDMLGHGNSQNPTEGATLDDYADQLERLIVHLELDKAVTIVGFSMGGLVARAFALKYQHRVAKLVVLNSVFNRTEEQRENVLSRCVEVEQLGPIANVDAAIDRWFSKEYRGANPAQIKAFRERIVTNNKIGYLRTYQLFGQSDNYGFGIIEKISVPTLISTGDLDIGSTPAMAYDMAKRMPNAKVIILEDQRHMMVVEAPSLVNDMLMDFLSHQKEQVTLQEVANGA